MSLIVSETSRKGLMLNLLALIYLVQPSINAQILSEDMQIQLNQHSQNSSVQNDPTSFPELSESHRQTSLEQSRSQQSEVYQRLEVLENTDDPTQTPPSISVSVGQFIMSSSTQNTLENSRTEIPLTNTTSLPRSLEDMAYFERIKNITSSIINGYKVLIILRGPSGSGKTTLANSIVRSTVGGDPTQFIFGTDDYWIMLGEGTYQFDYSKLREAHRWNENRVSNALREGVSPVLVDNTNIQSWEMQPYVVAGVRYGYIIEVLEPNTPWSKNVATLVAKNKHGVPMERIRQKIELYEHNVTGAKLIEQFSLQYSYGSVPPQPRKFPLFNVTNEGQVNLEENTSVGV